MYVKEFIRNYILENKDDLEILDYDLIFKECKKKCNTDQTIESFKRAFRGIRQKLYKEDTSFKSAVSSVDTPDGKKTFTQIVKSTELISEEDMVKFCGLDSKIWKASKITCNNWGNDDNPNYQYKVEFKQIDDKEKLDLLIDEFIEKSAKHSPTSYKKIKYNKPISSGKLLEVSLFDHHFGQLCTKEVTGTDYNLEIAKSLMLESCEFIISEYKHRKDIERILIPVGNDFFNVDSKFNTTTKGTYQDESELWQPTFVKGRDLYIAMIDRFRQIAPVDVIVIPGNHDEQRMFYLGVVLDAWYKKDPHVTIDITFKPRKYYLWGKSLIGFTHGDKEIKGALSSLMSIEAKELWYQSKYQEWHKGHVHHYSSKEKKLIEEYYGVREITLPSLTPMDVWHQGKGYTALRETISFLWDKEKGKVSQTHYHP